MTREIWQAPSTYLIQGRGPYAADWPYVAGGVRVAVIAGAQRVELTAAEYTINPPHSDLRGDVTLRADIALLHAGSRVVIWRDTPREQGWQGLLGERERGLEAQLDLLTMGVQELTASLAGAVRTDTAAQPIVAVPGAAVIFDAQGQPIPGPDASQIALASVRAAETIEAAAQVIEAEGRIAALLYDYEANAPDWAALYVRQVTA